MAEAEEYPVKLYVYDLSKGMARHLSLPILGKQINGVWHTGIVLYGFEFFFGSGGISHCRPGGTILGEPDRIIDLGMTQVPLDMFKDYLNDLSSSSYKGVKYHLFEHNCNNFSAEVAQFLTGKSIPSEITNLPQEVINTPFGAMIKNMIDSVEVLPQHDTPQTLDWPAPNRPGNNVPSSSSTTAQTSKPSVPPVTYQDESLPKKEILQISNPVLTTEELNLLQEIFGCLGEGVPPSLGTGHLQVIGKLMKSCDISMAQRLQIMVLLQLLMLRENFVQMVSADSNKILIEILQKAHTQASDLKKQCLKMMVNCSSWKVGRKLLTGTIEAGRNALTLLKLTKDLCISCLLQREDPDLAVCAAALVHNLSRGKIDGDTVVELASAVLEVLQRDITSKIGEYSLTALSAFVKASPEVKALTEVMSLPWSKLSALSQTTKKYCLQIQSVLR